MNLKKIEEVWGKSHRQSSRTTHGHFWRVVYQGHEFSARYDTNVSMINVELHNPPNSLKLDVGRDRLALMRVDEALKLLKPKPPC